MESRDVITVLVIVLMIVLLYMYMEGLKNDANVRLFAVKQPGTPLVIWFHKETCPWCVKMKEEYMRFKRNMRSSGAAFVEIELNKLKEKFDKVTQDFYMALFNSGPQTVPYVIAVYKGQIYPYNGDRTAADLEKWVMSVPSIAPGTPAKE